MTDSYDLSPAGFTTAGIAQLLSLLPNCRVKLCCVHVWVYLWEWQLTLGTRTWVSIKQHFLACWISSLWGQPQSASKIILPNLHSIVFAQFKASHSQSPAASGAKQRRHRMWHLFFVYKYRCVQKYSILLFPESMWMLKHFFCLSFISRLEGGRGEILDCSHYAHGGVKPLNEPCPQIITWYTTAPISVFTSKGVPNVTWGHPSLFYLCADLRTASGCWTDDASQEIKASFWMLNKKNPTYKAPPINIFLLKWNLI